MARTQKKQGHKWTYISYNTKEYLQQLLEKMDFIEYYLFIEHKSETETGKRHIHLYIEINDETTNDDMEELKKESIETTEDDTQESGEKLIQCRPCKSTTDFILYNIHNPDYLKHKNMKRKIQYDIKDFITNNDDRTQTLTQDALEEARKYYSYFKKVYTLYYDGLSYFQILDELNINYNQMQQVLWLISQIDYERRQREELEQEQHEILNREWDNWNYNKN